MDAITQVPRPGGTHPRPVDRDRPLPADTDPDFPWFGHAQQQILDRLRSGVLAGAGVLLLTGDVGTGKTILARALLHRLRADAIIATVMYARDNPVDFWKEIGGRWGADGAPDTREAFDDRLRALLDAAAASDKRVLLLVDEAQGLSQDVLAEIGRLAVMAGEPGRPARLSILLVGQDELGTVLSRPENAALAKRVGVRCVTVPLTDEEVREYMAHQLMRDGREGAVITDAGLQALAVASQGIPRLINTIADLALLSSSQQGTSTIGPEVVRQCARRLEQSSARDDRSRPPTQATAGARTARARRAERRAVLYVPIFALLMALAGYLYQSAWWGHAARAVNTTALPPRAPTPEPPDSGGTTGPAPAPQASDTGPPVALAPGPPDAPVQPVVERPIEPPTTARPARPPTSPVAEAATARSESTVAEAAPPAPNQMATAPATGGARRPREVQAREESEPIDPGGIIDWLLRESRARRQ